MASDLDAPQRYDVGDSEVVMVSLSFDEVLDTGELLTGTPTVTEVGSSDLTITNERVSVATLTINNKQVIAGRAAQCLVSGFVVGSAYVLKVSCGTDASPAQTRVGRVHLTCVEDG